MVTAWRLGRSLKIFQPGRLLNYKSKFIRDSIPGVTGRLELKSNNEQEKWACIRRAAILQTGCAIFLSIRHSTSIDVVF